MKLDRMFAYAVVLALLAGGTAWAEEKPSGEKPKAAESAPPRPSLRRIVEIKNRDGLRGLEELARGLGVAYTTSSELGVIVLSGTPENVAAAAAAIQKYDTPREAERKLRQRNAELTAYLLVAHPEGEPLPIPSLLVPVVDQLKTSFPYKRYELVETLVARVREDLRQGGPGHAVLSGVLPALSAGTSGKTFYVLEFKGVRINGADGAATINLELVRLKIEAPFPGDPGPEGKPIIQRRDNTLMTSTDIREGQTVVLGKAAVDGSGSSLILVLTAKVVE